MRHDGDKPNDGHGSPTAPLNQRADRPEACRVDQTPVHISRYEKPRHCAGDAAGSCPGDPPAGAEQHPGNDPQGHARDKQQAGHDMDRKENQGGRRGAA